MFCFGNITVFDTEVFSQTSQGGVIHYVTSATYYLSTIWNIMNADAHLAFKCQELNSDLLREEKKDSIISWTQKKLNPGA